MMNGNYLLDDLIFKLEDKDDEKDNEKNNEKEKGKDDEKEKDKDKDKDDEKDKTAIFNEHRHLIYGTFDDIINYIVKTNENSNIIDNYKNIIDFFNTYLFFSNVDETISTLLKKTTDYNLKQSVDDIFKYWIKNYLVDFINDDKNYNILKNYIDEKCKSLNVVLDISYKSHHNDVNLTNNLFEKYVSPTFNFTDNLNNIVADYDSKEIAEQLTLITYKIFKRVTSREIYSYSSKNGNYPNLKILISIYESLHKLCKNVIQNVTFLKESKKRDTRDTKIKDPKKIKKINLDYKPRSSYTKDKYFEPLLEEINAPYSNIPVLSHEASNSSISDVYPLKNCDTECNYKKMYSMTETLKWFVSITEHLINLKNFDCAHSICNFLLLFFNNKDNKKNYEKIYNQIDMIQKNFETENYREWLKASVPPKIPLIFKCLKTFTYKKEEVDLCMKFNIINYDKWKKYSTIIEDIKNYQSSSYDIRETKSYKLLAFYLFNKNSADDNDNDDCNNSALKTHSRKKSHSDPPPKYFNHEDKLDRKINYSQSSRVDIPAKKVKSKSTPNSYNRSESSSIESKWKNGSLYSNSEENIDFDIFSSANLKALSANDLPHFTDKENRNNNDNNLNNSENNNNKFPKKRSQSLFSCDSDSAFYSQNNSDNSQTIQSQKTMLDNAIGMYRKNISVSNNSLSEEKFPSIHNSQFKN